MTDPEPPPAPAPPVRMGWGWRAFFLLTAAVAVGVPIGSTVAAFVAPRNWVLGWCGIPFSAVAVLLAGLNIYIAFRPLLYRWRKGSLDGFRSSSVAGLVGNGFGTLGAALGWGDAWAAVPALMAVTLDCGGFPWFLYAMIRTRQF